MLGAGAPTPALHYSPLAGPYYQYPLGGAHPLWQAITSPSPAWERGIVKGRVLTSAGLPDPLNGDAGVLLGFLVGMPASSGESHISLPSGREDDT